MGEGDITYEVTQNGELWLEMDDQERYGGDGFATHGGLGWPGNRRVGIGRIDGKSEITN